MTTIFNFEDWFKTLTLSVDIHDKYETTLLDLLENATDVSSYTTSYNLIVNDIGFIKKDENDKYFVDITIPRVGDINTCFIGCPYDMSNNTPNGMKMELIMNGKKIPIHYDTKLVNASAIFTELKIRLTYDNEPFSVRFKYLNYVLQSELKDYLIKETFIQNGIRYCEGVAMPV